MTSAERTWWGEYAIPTGEARRWRIGPATLWLEHRPGEWVVRQESGGDPFADSLEVALPCSRDEVEKLEVPQQRFAEGASASDRVGLLPRLADRDVISRPEDPFSVLPGADVTVHVGTPLWVEIALLPGPRPVMELPLVRPSDTWFGANSRIGQLCYASRTRCRMRAEDVRWSPHRAVTEVMIRNASSTPLPIERINVPVPMLELWVRDSGALCTSHISYTREGDEEDQAALDTGAALPGATRIATARVARRTGLVRAFSRLI